VDGKVNQKIFLLSGFAALPRYLNLNVSLGLNLVVGDNLACPTGITRFLPECFFYLVHQTDRK
jgi:hypothetical protein